MSSEEAETTTAPPAAEKTEEKDAEPAAVAVPKKKEADEHESTAHFEPVVKLEEVETKTGEEEEETIHAIRAKLFVFGETMLDKGTGKKSWRERGIGEIKILKHREHCKSRILMRQEKTMKIIANHALDPRITLEPNAGSDRSWVWSAFDFSDGELVETVFAARFSDSDIANTFKEKFQEYQKDMEKVLAGDDSETGKEAADEVAKALEGLKTKDDDDEDKAE